MFTKTIEQIFTKEKLKNAFKEISSTTKGIDEVSYTKFKTNLSINILNIINEIQKGEYSPEPLKRIEIKKENSNEKRPISLSSIKDKLVQRCLYINLNSYFEKVFSNKSYAYRNNKSVLKAINRTSSFLQEKNHWILKTDIDNSFEEINHIKLLKILEKYIKDKKLLRLISLFLNIGSFKSYDYDEHNLGIHQGDIISPLLSNIYLNQMDLFLEKYNIPFVRFADDFIVLSKKEKDIYILKEKLEHFLKILDLKLEKEKTTIVHISKGFVFLGVHFEGKNRYIDNQRLQKSISKLHKLSKNKSGFIKFIENLNFYLEGLKNYYFKIIQKNSNQYQSLCEHLIETISQKVYLSKQSKQINTKKEFKNLLLKIKFDLLFEDEQIKDKINLIIAKAYEKYLANKSYSNTKAKIDKKKNQYAKKFANDTTLHISKSGLALGIAKNKFVLKEYGKVQKTYPIEKIKRVIFESKGLSISTNLIQRCAKESITIDFINQNALAYASLITYKSSTTQIIHKQALILNTPKQLDLAKQFIKGKAKNQINYLKYLNKYHKLLNSNINSIQKMLNNIKKTKTTQELMGYEGSISSLYWDSLKLVIEVPFEKRVTLGAKDIVNSSLNYAYAILYGKVQHSLVYAGLSLNISFLHTLDEYKPTLTFDMIEEFRTFIVDRTIISMLNKDEPINLDNKGLLTKTSRQLIAKNIKEKLGSYTMWKKQSHKCENIIQTQAYNLAKAIQNDSFKYKAFIGKY